MRWMLAILFLGIGCVSASKYQKLEKACQMLSESGDELLAVTDRLVESHQELGRRLRECEDGKTF